jgi:hypothetical protein
MKATELFRHLARALDECEIPYMLTGSFASNVYGMGRGTMDVDLVVSATAEQIKELSTLLPEPGYNFDLELALEALRHTSMFNVFDLVRGWKVDFIFQKPSAFHVEALRRRTYADVEGVPLAIITPEDLIVAKLEWAKAGSSWRQIEDVAGILKVRSRSLDRAYIEKWVRELGLASQWESARKEAAVDWH